MGNKRRNRPAEPGWEEDEVWAGEGGTAPEPDINAYGGMDGYGGMDTRYAVDGYGDVDTRYTADGYDDMDDRYTADGYDDVEAGYAVDGYDDVEAGYTADGYDGMETVPRVDRYYGRGDSMAGNDRGKQPQERNQDGGSPHANSRKQGKPAGKTAAAKIGHALTTLLLALVVTISLGAVGFLLLQVSGKNSLYSRADSSELVATLSGMAVELGDGAGDSGLQNDGTGDWQEGDIRYNGTHYRYNADILTFLFLGIDKMEEVQPVRDGIDGGQSDAIFLLVLDSHKKKISVIGIPRDTMAEVDIYSREGEYLRTGELQITLQHGYGDGAEVSCERSMAAVSRLFYGLPIHGYCAVNMGAVPLLNDAVGGIDLESLETLDFRDFHAEEGEELHLEGMDAYYYLHNRDTNSFNSAGRRLERQKQYLEAYAGAAIEKVKGDLTFPVNLYSLLSRYMVTDITVDEVGYLATQVTGYGFDGGDMHILEGETVMGDRYEQFYVDEGALYRLIIEVFYEEVP